MRIRISLGCAVLLLALGLPMRGADPVWIQLTSRNFVLYTDTTEIKGRRLLEDFEGRLAGLASGLGPIPQRQFPIEVFLFSKKEEFLEAAPKPTGSDAPLEFEKSAYLLRGPDRILVAARDKSPSDISDDVGHALGHVFFERLVTWRQFWLAEGVAEHFRKIGRSADNKRVSEKDGYPLQDLVDIVVPPKYDDNAKPDPSIAAFRIQSHRLFRLMLARHPMELQAYMKGLAALDGEDTRLMADVKALQAEFNGYSETVAPPGTGSFDIKTVPLSSAAMSLHRGDLLLAAGKPSEAASWYQADTVPARSARAILSRFSRSGGEPLRLLARAATDLPDDGLVQYHLGAVETRTPDDLLLQVKALDRSIALLPRFGRAHSQLARVNILLGKGELALTEIDRALALEPEYADQFQLIRAEALLSLNRFGEATAAARLAAALPHTDTTVDYDFKSSELVRRVDETRRELEGRQLQRIRDQVQAIVNEREPPPPPPPPPSTRPTDRFGKIEYSVQSSRQLSIVNAPLPIYSNALIQKGAAGQITIRVTIASDGKVTQASVADSQLQEMNAATLDAARKWTFAPAAGRAPVDARIVFTFSVQ